MRGTTIAAVSSPPGPGLRGVIRLSGPAAQGIVAAAARLERPLARRGLYRGRFLDGRGEQPLLLAWMPGPRSYTRQDVAELHLPGSPWLLGAALQRLLELGAEPAEPGEFTRRAFESGRIDLLQAEGVLELVQASGELERRAGLALLSGGLGARVAGLREGLEQLRALCEASLDFDQDDTGHVPVGDLLARGREVRADLDAALRWEERREPLGDLPRVVLAGAPNAGKSSLFNRLCPDGRALVSDLAGTTRDYLVGIWPLGPRGVRLVDTAGLDEGVAAAAEPDRLAQERARAEQASADLVLLLVDPAGPVPPLPEGPRCGLLWSKADVGVRPRAQAGPLADLPSVRISSRTGAGLGELRALVARLLGLERGGAPSEGAVDGRALSLRHRRGLAVARAGLEEALEQLEGGVPLDLVAGALRHANEALDGLSGRTTPEDLLDRIFARFCLGK